MNRGRAYLEITLHVSLGGRPAVDLAVVVDEGKVLTLFVCEGFRRHERSVLGYQPGTCRAVDRQAPKVERRPGEASALQVADKRTTQPRGPSPLSVSELAEISGQYL